MAAGIQAGIGNVAAGSLFASLTSAGMGGAALAGVQGAAGGVVGAVAAGSAYVFRGTENKKDEETKGPEGSTEAKRNTPKPKL